MSLFNEPIFHWMAQYAYQPGLVYLFVIGMMIASGFGFPLPEEVTILTVGVIAFMGANPDLFPPPDVNAKVVNGYEAAAITTIAVIFTDCLVFMLGRIFGRRLIQLPRFKMVFNEKVMGQINSWVKRYGIFAAFIFRFTPGIRFPAHIAFGMLAFPVWQFVLVDSIAACISVPTQILLVYHYGEPILIKLQQFKYVFLAILLVGGLVFLFKQVISRFFLKKKTAG